MIFSQNPKTSRQRSFTLLELLIVLGILAILAVIVLLVINPAEYLRRTRDTKRQTDLQTLNSAIAFSQGIDFGLSLGLASTVYVSLPDSTTTCANLGLPALPPTWQYHCSSVADYQKTNGAGWVPINFNSLSTGSPLANLPVDPVNASTSNLYYVYVTGGSWTLTGVFESQKYADISAQDGGHDPMAYEVGSNLTLAPSRSIYLSVGSDCALYHAYWDGTATDHSIYANNGTVIGAIFIENALSFDGTDDQVALIPAASLQLGTHDYASFFWIKPLSTMLHYGRLYYRSGGSPFLEEGITLYTGLNMYNFAYIDDYYNDIHLPLLTPDTWVFIGYEIDRDVGAYMSINGSIVAGPAGNLFPGSLPAPATISIASNAGIGEYLKILIGETFWFNTFGTYSSGTRLDIFNATKARYGL